MSRVLINDISLDLWKNDITGVVYREMGRHCRVSLVRGGISRDYLIDIGEWSSVRALAKDLHIPLNRELAFVNYIGVVAAIAVAVLFALSGEY